MLDAKPRIAVALPNSSKNWMKRKLSIRLKNIANNFNDIEELEFVLFLKNCSYFVSK